MHSCLKEPPEEIYNLIFMLLTQQCILFRDWNTLLKYFSWSHFCHFLFVLFQAVKVDVRVSRNNFSRGLEMLEMLENVQNLKNMQFFSISRRGRRGQKMLGTHQQVFYQPRKNCESARNCTFRNWVLLNWFPLLYISLPNSCGMPLS